MTPWAAGWYADVVFLLALVATLIFQLPQLAFESPPELEAVRARLAGIDPQRLADVAELTGADSSPVRVILSREGSPLALQVPRWIVGFADAEANLIVLFPSRTPSYPHASLEDVLRHEVAHVLIRRTVERGVIPRWFNEGLAMAAERGWRLEDRTRLISLLVTGLHADAAHLDRLFAGGQSEQARAYTLSGALVRDLLQHSGRDAPLRILQKVGAGMTFEAAFADVTGITPAEANAAFWDRRGFWTRWLPIVFAQETLWLAVTLLAILAIRRRRRRNAEIESRWAEEDRQGPLDRHP